MKTSRGKGAVPVAMLRTGLKILSRDIWFGPGYCGICDTRGETLIPQAVRWWDPDDGWKMGVLCRSCAEDAAARGPRPDDFAVIVARDKDDACDRAAMIDTATEIGDLDGAFTDSEDEA